MLTRVPKLYKVFVYGTLKKNQPNHHWFSENSDRSYKFLCQAETVEKYPLVIATRYNIPCMLYHPGFGNNVQGEVYEVNDTVLQDLDELKDHPNFYERFQFLVRPTGTRGLKLRAWVYLIPQFQPELLNKPMYEVYASEGKHGLQFVREFERFAQYDYQAEILR